MLGKGVFIRNLFIENFLQKRPGLGEFRKFKVTWLTKSNDEDSLAMLGNQSLGVDDLVIYFVAQGIGQGVANDFERPFVVVALQVFDIF